MSGEAQKTYGVINYLTDDSIQEIEKIGGVDTVRNNELIYGIIKSQVMSVREAMSHEKILASNAIKSGIDPWLLMFGIEKKLIVDDVSGGTEAPKGRSLAKSVMSIK